MSIPSLPPEIWMRVVQLLWDPNHVHNVGALASVSHALAGCCQPILFKNISFHRRAPTQRSPSCMRKRKEEFLRIMEDHRSLCNHITGLKLVSDYNNISWMRDDLMLRIVSFLSRQTSLTSLEISGQRKTGVDGRHLHDTLFARLPRTITHVALNNVRGLSPLSFQAFRQVVDLRFTGVFTRAAGRQTLAETVRNFPPPPSEHRPHVRTLEYSRHPKSGEEWTGRSMEVLPLYVNFQQLEEADFQTYADDDVSTLIAALRAGRESLKRLTVNVSGLTRDGDISRPSRTDISRLDNLNILSINTEYWEVYPIQSRPWQAVSYVLGVLNCPNVETVKVVNHYGGRSRQDWVRFVASGGEWETLDNALHRFIGDHEGLLLHLVFKDFNRLGAMDWSREEDEWRYRYLYRHRCPVRAGELTFGELSDSQLSKLLPRTFAQTTPITSWT